MIISFTAITNQCVLVSGLILTSVVSGTCLIQTDIFILGFLILIKIPFNLLKNIFGNLYKFQPTSNFSDKGEVLKEDSLTQTTLPVT